MQQLQDQPLVRPADMSYLQRPYQAPSQPRDLGDDEAVFAMMARVQAQSIVPAAPVMVQVSEQLIGELLKQREIPKPDPLRMGLFVVACSVWVLAAGVYFFRSPEQSMANQNQQLIQQLSQQNQQLMAENQRLATINSKLAAEGIKRKGCIGLCFGNN